MYMINCHSCTITYKKLCNMRDSDVYAECSFEYGIEVPLELFQAISVNVIEVIPQYGETKNGEELVKCYFFTKHSSLNTLKRRKK